MGLEMRLKMERVREDVKEHDAARREARAFVS